MNTPDELRKHSKILSSEAVTLVTSAEDSLDTRVAQIASTLSLSAIVLSCTADICERLDDISTQLRTLIGQGNRIV